MRYLRALLIIGLVFAHTNAVALDIGDTPPAFSLKNIAGETRALEDYKGKVVLIDFWATWCPPCLISLPWLSEIQTKHGTSEFVVLAITVDKELEKVKRFLSKFNIALEVLSDPTGEVAQQYSLPTMPTSFLIDRGGKVTAIHQGFRSSEIDDYREKIEKAISSKDPT